MDGIGMNSGCYFKIEDNWIGIFQSKDGPKLFFNKEIYPLSLDCWDAEWVLGKKNQLFAFYWNGESKISLRLSNHSAAVEEMNLHLPKHQHAG